jgi:glycosyltransferase involved in cell wall biosynthesis
MDDRALAEALSSVATDEILRAKLRQAALRQASGFTWDSCAARTVSAYKLAIARK